MNNRDGSYRDASYRGRGAKRDAMGRYSRDDEIHHDLERLMSKATDERTREEIRSLMERL